MRHVPLIKKLMLTSIAVTSIFALSACDIPFLQNNDLENIPISTTYPDPQSLPETSDNVPQSEHVSLINWNQSVSPDYVMVLGEAEVQHDLQPGEYLYLPQDNLNRSAGAAAKITVDDRILAKNTDRADISHINPPGWNDNSEVTIPSANPNIERDYHGWFWNRSHLIADSLGGKPIVENFVTGTRPQNVGNSDNKGGMAYGENIARQYLDSDAAKYCPLYYAVTPQYIDDADIIPRTTVVDIQSCDKSIDTHIIVFNAANGFDINYTDATFSQK